MFTYDLTADVGKVRMLVYDTNVTYQRFSDEEIQALLDMCGSVFRAAAQALDITATTQVLLLKHLKSLDIETNGDAVAKELRAQAVALRERDDEDGGGFDIAEQVENDFSARERWFKQWQRGQS